MSRNSQDFPRVSDVVIDIIKNMPLFRAVFQIRQWANHAMMKHGYYTKRRINIRFTHTTNCIDC